MTYELYPFPVNCNIVINEFFELTGENKKLLKEMTPVFGFGQIGELIFRRTYSRGGESWSDVVIRVIEGVMSIRRNHYKNNGLFWCDSQQQQFAMDMAVSMFNMEWLPPGRGLWMMGTEFVYTRGSMGLFNCAAVDTGKDLVHAIEWTMDCLMNGVGVGFSTTWRGTASLPDKQQTETYVIPDDREGWINSVILLCSSYVDTPGLYPKCKYPTFDYSQLRPYGAAIRGFGGIASGPDPLVKLHKRIETFFENFCQGYITVESETSENKKFRKEYNHTRLITDIFNSLGACISAGNVRRCRPAGTKIKTLNRGVQAIENLLVGDMVESSYGSARVSEIIHQGHQQVCKILAGVDMSMMCTLNHRVFTVRFRKITVTEPSESTFRTTTEYHPVYEWKTASELRNFDYIVVNNNSNTLCVREYPFTDNDFPSEFLMRNTNSNNIIGNRVQSEFLKLARVQLVLVIENSTVDTWDISVDEVHEYFCEDGFLNHNSAEICLGSPEDETFMNLKNYEENPERAEIGWMSNNSVVLTKKTSFEDFSYLPKIANRIYDNGEPGLINLYNIQKYGLYGKNMPDDATLVNPCFSGDTLVAVGDSRVSVRIDHLAKIGEDVPVLTFDEIIGKQTVSWGMHPRITGTRQKLIRVFYQYNFSEYYLDVTPNHKFLTIFGETITADKLRQGVILPGFSEAVNGSGWSSKRLQTQIMDCEADYPTVLNHEHLIKHINAPDAHDKLTKAKIVAESDSAILEKTCEYRHCRKKFLVTKNMREYCFCSGHCWNKYETTKFFKQTHEKNNTFDYYYHDTRHDKPSDWQYSSPTDTRKMELSSSPLHLQNTVTRIEPLPGYHTVYNITVENQHIVGIVSKRVCNNNKQKTQSCDNEKYDNVKLSDKFIEHKEVEHGIFVRQCGEIALCSMETCNLSEVFPVRCDNYERYIQALKFATFYSSTVSLLPTHRSETNAIVSKNRRIGVSLSGMAQWVSNAVASNWGEMNYTRLTSILREGYAVVRQTNLRLANEAGVSPSIRVTCVKPSGTISLLAGATAGIHYPVSRYAIRRFRIGDNSPLVPTMILAGVPYEKDLFSDNTLVFSFLIDHGDVRPCEQVSPWEQFKFISLMQSCWADNCVSATVYFDKEKDKNDIEKLLAMFIPNLKSVSMLPHSGHGYKQAPYEPLTEEQYNNLKNTTFFTSSRIDFDSVTSNVPTGSKFCTNEMCEL